MTEILDVNTAIVEEENLPSGKYEVRCYVDRPISEEELDELRCTLAQQGIDASVFSGPDYFSIKYIRYDIGDGITALPVAIIPLIGLGLITAIIGIGIFKLEDIAKVLLIGGGILIVSIALLRKPIEKYVERH